MGIRASVNVELTANQVQRLVFKVEDKGQYEQLERAKNCLLYTSEAADERSSVDLGGRRIIK